MRRVAQSPRPNWIQRNEEIGFHFHSVDEHGDIPPSDINQFRYWNETVAYEFTSQQIDTIDDATQEVHNMCMDAVDRIVSRGEYDKVGIAESGVCSLIETSWNRRDPHLYGRFDVSWDGTAHPKFLEYNADTPTSLIEASLAQWFWLQDVYPEADQFNSIHEQLIERWQQIANQYRKRGEPFHKIQFVASLECQEDVGNLEYLMDTATQAGLYTSICDIVDIAVNAATGEIVDDRGANLESCFKLYPWEYMAFDDENKVHLHKFKTHWIEPVWKMLLSNKALWPYMWQLHKGHPNLLASSMYPEDIDGAMVKKPIFSREGANILMMDNQKFPEYETAGDYGKEGFIYQEMARLPKFEEFYTVLGTWVVGDKSCGMGIREDYSPITKNTSYFIPHYFN